MRTARQKLQDNLMDNEEVIIIDDDAFNESLIGVSEDMREIYDYEKMAEEFAAYHGCDIVDARDYIDFNIINGLSNYGSKHPIIMDALI